MTDTHTHTPLAAYGRCALFVCLSVCLSVCVTVAHVRPIHGLVHREGHELVCPVRMYGWPNQLTVKALRVHGAGGIKASIASYSLTHTQVICVYSVFYTQHGSSNAHRLPPLALARHLGRIASGGVAVPLLRTHCTHTHTHAHTYPSIHPSIHPTHNAGSCPSPNCYVRLASMTIIPNVPTIARPCENTRSAQLRMIICVSVSHPHSLRSFVHLKE